MSRSFILLMCVAVVLVQGRPRHHKRKHAHEDTKAFYGQPLSDAPAAAPEDLSVYNVHVHKMEKDNQVSGHIGPHSVSVSMQGPGMVNLDTSQMQVGPEEPKPDHTVTMVKDTEGCNGRQCSSVNVKSGHQLPMPLPLTGEWTPAEAPKESSHHDVKPAAEPKEPAKLHTKPEAKVEPEVELQHAIEHAHKHKDEHAPEEETLDPAIADIDKVHAQIHAKLKEHARKIIKTLESTVPVAHHKNPKKEKEEALNNGHQVFVSNEGKPQKVFGQMDSNNVGMSVQGPGTVSVTSQFDVPQVSQTVIYDPIEACHDKPCPSGNGDEQQDEEHN